MGAGLDELLGCRGGVVHVEREADRARHPPTDLDAIEGLGLLGVEQLEGCPTGVKDRPPAVRTHPRLDLGESEGVPIEGDRAVIVIDGQGDAELANVRHALDGTKRRPMRQTRGMTTSDVPGSAEALASWGAFAAAAPEVAAAGARHLDGSEGAALLATVRGAGAPPRIHPVTVGIKGGGLYVFLLDSAKRGDLAEDGRFALHAHQDPAAPDEFSVRGRARLVPAGEERAKVAEGWYFTVDDTYWLFELRLQSAILGVRGADEWPPRYTRWSASP